MKKNKSKGVTNDPLKKNVSKTVKDLIPISDYDDNTDCFLLKDNTYMDIIQIKTKDMINSADDENEYDCLRYTKLYRLYADDLKMIAINFPCNTQEQQRYLEHKIAGTKNQVFKSFLQKRKDELVWIEKNNTTREYYFMIFGKKASDIEKNRITMGNTVGFGTVGLLEQISKERKHQVLFKINNKNFLVSEQGED